jgi:hypothetical protein
MELTVRAFNEAYEMANLVNGILHFLNSSGWKGLLFIAMCLTLIAALISAARKIQMPMVLLLAFFFPLSLYTALITTKSKLNISDEYTMESFSLDNVPFGLAMPLSVSSHLEMGLTELIDNNVRPATSPSFFTVDFMGSARMMSAVTNSNLYNVPHIIKTIAEYGKNCVIPALAAGDITYDQIQRESDLTSYLNLGYQVFFSPIYTASGTSSIGTCDIAYQWILNELNIYSNIGYGSDFSKQVTSYMGRRGNNVALAAATLNAGVSSLFSGFQDSSEQLFQQLFMLNGLKRTLSTINPTLGLSMAEVEQKQISAQTVAGLLNIKHLSRYRTFLKLFLIAVMPIIASFWFCNLGRSFALWCGTFLWVSLFLPLEAAIHAVYTATTLAEMRNFTDPFGGYTMLTEGSVLRWATETNAMASNLMLGIFAFSALILKMSIPAAGQAVMSMITASQNQTRFQSQAASNVLEATERRAIGMASDRTAELMLTKGQYKAAMNRADDAQFNAFENKKGSGGNLVGKDPAWTRTNEDEISRSLGGNATLTASVTDSMSQAADSAVTDNWSKMRSITSGYRGSSSTSVSESDVQAYKGELSKVATASTMAQYSKGLSQAQQLAGEQARAAGLDENSVKKAQAHAGMDFSFGFSKLLSGDTKSLDKLGIKTGPGIGGGTNVEKGISDKSSVSSDNKVSESEAVSKLAQNAASSGVSRAGSVGRSDSYSTSTGSQQTRENSLQDLTQTLSGLSKAMSNRSAINSASSAGGSVSLNVDNVVGKEYDAAKYQNLRAESPRLNSLFNNNPHAGVRDMQVALAQDIRDSIMQGPAAVSRIANGMREQGFANMGTFTDIVNAGGQVHATFGGKDYEMPGGGQIKGGSTIFTKTGGQSAAGDVANGSTRGAGTSHAPAAVSRRTGGAQVSGPGVEDLPRGGKGSSGGARKMSGGTVRVNVGRAGGTPRASSAGSQGSGGDLSPGYGDDALPPMPQGGAMPKRPEPLAAQAGRGPRAGSAAQAAFDAFGPGGQDNGAIQKPLVYPGKVSAYDVTAPEGTQQANERREEEKQVIQQKTNEKEQTHNKMNRATTFALDVQEQSVPIITEVFEDPKGAMTKFGDAAAKGRPPDF